MRGCTSCFGCRYKMAGKTAQQANPNSADIYRVCDGDWARHYSHPEVFVNDQGNEFEGDFSKGRGRTCLLYTSPSPRDRG